MKYIVGFSGGIDSAFVAWKLKQAGHKVLLVNLKNTAEKNKCCEVPTKLFEIANSLDLPIKIIDATEDFKKLVIDNFIKTYLKGKTPNPCINCNEFVRFQILDKIRKEFGYDFITTGHYVKRVDIDGFHTFAIPEDKTKDQTYMLYRLLKYQDIVKHLDFPIHKYLKKDIKKIIIKHNIPVNTEQESQNICFVPDDDYPNYIKNHTNIKFKKGSIIDIRTGEILGEHNGVINYTIGQRKGLNLKTNEKKYVVSIDYKNNIIKVGDDEDLFTKKVCVDELDYFKAYTGSIYGKIRYKAPLQEIEKIEGNCVYFKNPVRAVTPGQHLVLYAYKNGNYFVLGGGEII